MILLEISAIPLLLSLFSVFVRQSAVVTRVSAVLMCLQTLLVSWIMLCCWFTPEMLNSFPVNFRPDRTGLIFLLIITVVVTAAVSHAVTYFEWEGKNSHSPAIQSIRRFYIVMPLFLLAMYAVCLSDHLGYLWISLEATTILSTPLVYHYRSSASIEAAWKYLIICSVGIAIALFGVAVLFAASQTISAFPDGTLSLSALSAYASQLPPHMLRFAFILLVLGFATKAGLFPLHNWLPDAHSEAPAPASAVLSGGLLNCAMLGLWKITQLMVAAGSADFARTVLLILGTATVVVGSGFLIRQWNIKRLLAYSSMEHMGLLAVTVALSSWEGFVFQAINHSLIKVALFLLTGNLLQEYGSKRIKELRGLLSLSPWHGVLLLAGFFAITGTPPFGSFFAEWIALVSAMAKGLTGVVILLLAALSVVFIAMSIYLVGMIFGESPKTLSQLGDNSLARFAVPLILILISLVFGFATMPVALLTRGGIL